LLNLHLKHSYRLNRRLQASLYIVAKKTHVFIDQIVEKQSISFFCRRRAALASKKLFENFTFVKFYNLDGKSKRGFLEVFQDQRAKTSTVSVDWMKTSSISFELTSACFFQEWSAAFAWLLEHPLIGRLWVWIQQQLSKGRK